MTYDEAYATVKTRAARQCGVTFTEQAMEAAAYALMGIEPPPELPEVVYVEPRDHNPLRALCTHATHTWGAAKGSLENTLI